MSEEAKVLIFKKLFLFDKNISMVDFRSPVKTVIKFSKHSMPLVGWPNAEYQLGLMHQLPML